MNTTNIPTANGVALLWFDNRDSDNPCWVLRRQNSDTPFYGDANQSEESALAYAYGILEGELA